MNALDKIACDEICREIRNKVMFDEKRYLIGLSWTVDAKPETASKHDIETDDFRPLTDNEWNEVHHIDYNTAYLIVPITRFSDVTEVIPIGKEISAKSVITKVHEFYHTPLTQQQIDNVKDYCECGGDLGYSEELIAKSSNGETVAYVDLRGAAIYFEGIKRVAGNVYKLEFGS